MRIVLTREQLIEAVVRGAPLIDGGVVTESLGDRLLKSVAYVTVEQVHNGAILELDDRLEGGDGSEARRAESTELVAPPKPDAAKSLQPIGPKPEKIKAALAAVMDRPPGLTTIRTWTATQRRLALKWSKDPAAQRPNFIVDRAARKTRPEAKRNGTSQTASPDVGKAMSGSDFFEKED
jgi:hypothetical protein